ncbi:MAG: serine hydrolase [Rhodospirillales bacterium]|nr:serine hydrolase [Rhodospirillales bacterium]
MRRTIGVFAALAVLAAGVASAQSLRPGTPSLLRWTLEQQTEWYPAIETVYHSATVKRGDTVRPLPKADRTMGSLSYSQGEKSWTVEDYMKAYNVSGLMVVKDGKVLLERYGLGRKPEDRWISFSVTKSITSTLVGAAIKDGKIKSVDDQVTSYIPELKGSAYDGVTVRNLLTMSSGVKWNEDYADPNSDVARAGSTILEPGVNPIVSYMKALPRANEPGTKFHYNTGETDLAGILLSNAVAKSLSQYASEKLWQAYGMERDATWLTDIAGHERGGCCMSMTVGDYARIGQFMLDGGVAQGRQILPDGWIAQATSRQITDGAPPAGYGYFWWLGQGGAYQASGIFGQSISIIPDERLVIVLNSAWPTAVGRDLFVARSAFLNAVRAAAKGY